MDRTDLLRIVQPIMVEFKLDIAKMCAEGATQAEIDLMLDEFEELYAPQANEEGKLIMAVLRHAAQLPS